MIHVPRPGDLPREELLKQANKAVKKFGGADVCKVYFKFTCPMCGERCTFQEPNVLYEHGECYQCGADEPVNYGGFALDIRVH